MPYPTPIHFGRRRLRFPSRIRSELVQRQADGGSSRGVGARLHAPQLGTEFVEAQRADRIHRARAEPRVRAREQRRHGLAGVAHRRPDQPIGPRDPLLDRDVRIDERQQQVAQVRRQDVFEKLQRVCPNGGDRRPHADVGVVHRHLREQQLDQPEDPLDLLFHWRRQRLSLDRGRELRDARAPEALIRPVVPGDLGREHQLEKRRIDPDPRRRRLEQVQRNDDGVAH
jgi:hypothetical protein